MTRKRALSGQAHTVLQALLAAAGRWSHGYELTSGTGIKSGTLYPLLIRLEAEGLLEAEWQQPLASGRPPRHAYRLTAAGRNLARAEAAAAEAVAPTAEWRPGKAVS